MRLREETRPEDLEEEVITEELANNNLVIDFNQIANLALHGLNAKELEAVYNTAIELSPKVIGEIGAGSGISSVLLATIARDYKARLYTVEPYIHIPNWQNWIYNLNSFGLMEYVTLLSAHSPYINWDNLPFDVIDYLLIDGNHNSIAVIADFYMWSRHIPIGGRIAFHDCAHNPDVAKGIGMILTTLPYIKLVELDNLTIIEKANKTHGGKSGDKDGMWGNTISNANKYNMIVDFKPEIQSGDITKILHRIHQTLGVEIHIADIHDSSNRRPTHNTDRKQIFCYLKEFDSTISVIIDQHKCVVVFSSSDKCDLITTFITNHIESILGYKVSYVLATMDVI